MPIDGPRTIQPAVWELILEYNLQRSLYKFDGPVQGGKERCASDLLEAGADMNVVDAEGNTPQRGKLFPLCSEPAPTFSLPGSEVDYTACSSPVILKNSCSKLHCQKVLNQKPFAYKIVGGVPPRR